MFYRPDQFAFQHPQHCLQVVPAFEDLSFGADDAVHALFLPQVRAFLDPVKRMFGRAAKNRKHCHIAQMRDAIVPPLTGGDHAPVERQDDRQLMSVKSGDIADFRGGQNADIAHTSSLREMPFKSSLRTGGTKYVAAQSAGGPVKNVQRR